MAQYILPELSQPAPLGPNEILLVASGDQRETANRQCWPAQVQMESSIYAAFAQEGITVRRAYPFDSERGHGFISSQKRGIEIFRSIPKDAPIVVAGAVWQYSHHVLAGLREHHGPILTLANWSGEWPGLVGMLNLNGSLTKMGVDFSTIWSENFTDEYFKSGIRQWIREGRISHDATHVTDLNRANIPEEETQRRWSMTTAQWPIMHAILTGVSRDQMMARHKANHINVVYAPTAEIADRALAAKAAMLEAMGIQVHLCGVHI